MLQLWDTRCHHYSNVRPCYSECQGVFVFVSSGGRSIQILYLSKSSNATMSMYSIMSKSSYMQKCSYVK